MVGVNTRFFGITTGKFEKITDNAGLLANYQRLQRVAYGEHILTTCAEVSTYNGVV